MTYAMLPFDESRAHSWYRKWREKIHAWLERNGDSDWADILLLLPDLFMFAVGIMSDSRIPYKFKLALLSAVVYVLSPFDLIPEAVLGVAGLIDDAGILLILLDMLFGALNLEPDVLAQVIRDHWHRDEDVVSTIRVLLAKLKRMPGYLFGKLLNLVRRWWPYGRDNEPETGPAE
ncbi:MAG: YkvA family protein [Chloroflexi bacterium]|nr:YkvA family protein [Chloroflexota bacterium]